MCVLCLLLLSFFLSLSVSSPPPSVSSLMTISDFTPSSTPRVYSILSDSSGVLTSPDSCLYDPPVPTLPPLFWPPWIQPLPPPHGSHDTIRSAYFCEDCSGLLCPVTTLDSTYLLTDLTSFVPSSELILQSRVWSCAMDRSLSEYLNLATRDGSNFQIHDWGSPTGLLLHDTNEWDPSPELWVYPPPFTTSLSMWKVNDTFDPLIRIQDDTWWNDLSNSCGGDSGQPFTGLSSTEECFDEYSPLMFDPTPVWHTVHVVPHYDNASFTLDLEALKNEESVYVATAGVTGPAKGTISSPGSAKNVLAVGTLGLYGSEIGLLERSGRGPTGYGMMRIKPDVAFVGLDDGAQSLTCGNVNQSGLAPTESNANSVALMRVAAMLGTIRDYLETVGGVTNPTGLMIKATLLSVSETKDVTLLEPGSVEATRHPSYSPADEGIVSNSIGFGLPDLSRLEEETQTQRWFLDRQILTNDEIRPLQLFCPSMYQETGRYSASISYNDIPSRVAESLQSTSLQRHVSLYAMLRHHALTGSILFTERVEANNRSDGTRFTNNQKIVIENIDPSVSVCFYLEATGIQSGEILGDDGVTVLHSYDDTVLVAAVVELKNEYYDCDGSYGSYGNVCNGHGICIGQDVCNCTGGWSGDKCLTYPCYGLSKEDPTVCSGHGVCLGFAPGDNCICDSHGWFGDQCEYAPCWGHGGEDACNYPHGECIDYNDCECNDNWIGESCMTPPCFGLAQDDLMVCNHGNGSCVGLDQCDCNELWYGEECNEPKCYDLEKPELCNFMNGTCERDHICTCTTLYIGERCEIPPCYNYAQNDSQACSSISHGRCVGLDDCLCEPEWDNDECEDPVCYGEYGPDACNGEFGDCVAPNNCECVPHLLYIGEQCEIPPCYNYAQNDSQACSTISHGTCVGLDDCLCEPEWDNDECEDPVCNEEYGPDACNGELGECVSPGSCECVPADLYSGEWCHLPPCHGVSQDDPNVCTNETHGTCVGYDDCDCFDGWANDECEDPVCNGWFGPSACNGVFGDCVDPQTCVCTPEGLWTGDWCQLSPCFGHSRDDVDVVCNGPVHGECVGWDECDCVYNAWTGDNCSIPVCWGESGEDACSQHGECIYHDSCECEEDYGGPNCEIHRCFGELANNTDTACTGHGECLDVDVCNCTIDKYDGNRCEIPKCFDFWADEILRDQACSAPRGRCVDYNTCECEPGFVGEECEEFECMGIRSTDSREVCSWPRGTCVDGEECRCFGYSEGTHCNHTTCFGKSTKNQTENHPDRPCSYPNGECVLSFAGYPFCLCNPDKVGPQCQWNWCFGLPGPRGCSGHGECIEKEGGNVCECDDDYTGDRCLLLVEEDAAITFGEVIVIGGSIGGIILITLVVLFGGLVSICCVRCTKQVKEVDQSYSIHNTLELAVRDSSKNAVEMKKAGEVRRCKFKLIDEESGESRVCGDFFPSDELFVLHVRDVHQDMLQNLPAHYTDLGHALRPGAPQLGEGF